MLTFPRHVRGVTLIELMVVIAFIGLLLLVGLPAFGTMLANLRVRGVAESVLTGVQTARTEALTRNEDITFSLDAATGGAWSVRLAAGTKLQEKSAADGGAVNVALASGGNLIVFNRLGQRTTPPAATPVLNIDITNPGVDACEVDGGSVRCLRIMVSIGGQTRLCDPKRQAGDPQACS